MTSEFVNKVNSLIINNLKEAISELAEKKDGHHSLADFIFANIIRWLQLRMVVVVNEGGKGNDFHMAWVGFWVCPAARQCLQIARKRPKFQR